MIRMLGLMMLFFGFVFSVMLETKSLNEEMSLRGGQLPVEEEDEDAESCEMGNAYSLVGHCNGRIDRPEKPGPEYCPGYARYISDFSKSGIVTAVFSAPGKNCMTPCGFNCGTATNRMYFCDGSFADGPFGPVKPHPDVEPVEPIDP